MSLDASAAATKPVRNGASRVPVLLPYPFQGAFDYAQPEALALEPGDVVMVPLNRRAEVGVVWDAPVGLPGDLATPPPPSVADAKLKPVAALLDVPRMPESLRRFVDWVAGYTLSPPGLVLAMALRTNASQPVPPTTGWVRSGSNSATARVTPARARVLQALTDGAPRNTAELGRAAEVGTGVVRAMAEAGLLVEVAIAGPAAFGTPDPDHQDPVLSPDQNTTAQRLRGLVQGRRFQAALLDGVTGSGKTEVYLEAVAACLAEGRQALVLLPEIALSAQWMQRFVRRFGVEPAVWHSDLGSKRRRITWRAVAGGEAQVVVGARSALFLPFPDLGLVIVDEEHETAFKQEDGVTYHARDMAVVRARLSSAPVLLVSATPSLETLANVESGRYQHLTLAVRHGGATMPGVAAIDLRDHPPERGRFLSPVLIEAARAAMQPPDGRPAEQVMLFLNRRGYAPLTLCRTCGHRIQCPNCTAWLVEHRARRQLACHHCGHTEAVPTHCPACNAENSLTPIGPGVERITEEARLTFPDARLLVMASDTLPGPNAAAEAVRKIADREVDLIIGTQIVAKGWHFPGLTLVGVVDADLGLAGGDLRAAERTVQLLHQVGGRAGRAEAPGRVLLQTYNPTHPVMQALIANDFASFMQKEAAQRRPGWWPPYGRLAALIVSADTADAADAAAQTLGRSAPSGEGVQVLGPAPAPLAILRGRHRRRLLLRTRREIAVQPILRRWLDGLQFPRSVQVDVDIDPVSFL
ncbi:primosomal protein N' [Lichenicola sp.]|uniref:primosomal protein N' n=1 Tax=Lichenicola sp. TaxID=2804529 RepID=UPI003B00AED9